MLAATVATAGAQTAAPSLALIPQPRHVTRLHDLTLRRGVSIALPANSQDRFTARDLGDELKARRVRVVYGGAASVRIELVRTGTARARTLLAEAKIRWTPAMDAEGYAIVSGDSRLNVVAHSAAGIFYGAQTVKQLLDGEGSTATLHLVNVSDWPAMRYRGFHDDLSRGPDADAGVPEVSDPHPGGVQGERVLAVLREYALLRCEPGAGASGRRT